MSITRNATLSGQIDWAEISVSSFSTASNIGSVGESANLSGGDSGSLVFNCVFHDEISLSSGGSYVLDLQNLTQELFDETTQINFTNVRGICLGNKSTVGSFDVRSTGNNIFFGPMSSGAYYTVYPYSNYNVANPLVGWSIGATTKYLILNDGGQGCTVDIAIVGVSG